MKKSLFSPEKKHVLPFIAAVVFFLLIVSVQVILILSANDGTLVYTLDDPYIHLAMAENLLQGHYGINITEFSAPSSSIIWPFILAPFSFTALAPLLLNILFGICTLFVVWRIFTSTLHIAPAAGEQAVVTLLLGLFVLCSNLVGLVFTGMEHVLQVLIVAAIARALIGAAENRKSGVLLIVLLIAAPLVRYENMAVSAAGILFLLLRKNYSSALLSAAGIAVTAGSFTLFLLRAGHMAIPTSVAVKLGETGSGFSPQAVINHLKYSLAGPPQGMLFVIGLLGLLCFSLFSQQHIRERQLALCGSAAVAAHLAVGGYGWYNRYEIYIWVFLLLMFCYLLRHHLNRLFARRPARRVLLQFSAFITFGTCLVCSRYIWDLSTIAYASNNIFNQHYQMHRFAVDFYQEPVAVNDIGYVSYKNRHYVLDLWGLSSLEALTARLSSNNELTNMDQLMRTRNVSLAMIYPGWFRTIQQSWIKLGELVTDMDENKMIGPAARTVEFFVIDEKTRAETLPLIEAFKKTLPAGAAFFFTDRSIE